MAIIKYTLTVTVDDATVFFGTYKSSESLRAELYKADRAMEQKITDIDMEDMGYSAA